MGATRLRGSTQRGHQCVISRNVICLTSHTPRALQRPLRNKCLIRSGQKSLTALLFQYGASCRRQQPLQWGHSFILPTCIFHVVGSVLPGPPPPRHQRPFRVLQPKCFKLAIGANEEVVSVDRLKPHSVPVAVTVAQPPRRSPYQQQSRFQMDMQLTPCCKPPGQMCRE